MRDVVALPSRSTRRPDSDSASGEDFALLERVMRDWLLGYTAATTRLSYGDALGLDRGWLNDLASPLAARATAQAAARPAPPIRRGKYRDLAWLRWCDRQRLHPLAVVSADVKRWQLDLVAAGMPKTTRGHRLAVVGKLYGYLAEHGVTDSDPTRFDRGGLGLHAHRDTSATVVLTAEQVDLLLRTAARPRQGVSPLMASRAVAIVALFTLGLRVSELTGLRRGHLHVNRGRRALRVMGKGGKIRVVYLSGLAAEVLQAYLAERDRWASTAVPALPGQLSPHDSPLIATRDGGVLDSRDVWALLRRIARAAGPALAEIADRFGPHVLRHFYVTAAAEGGADMTHVQADVGHASVDTTQRVYNQAARHPDRSAVDIVENILVRAWSERRPDQPNHLDEAHALSVLDHGLNRDDPVEQLHGLQQLQRVLSLSSALSAKTAERIATLVDRADLHPRVADLARVVHRLSTH